MIKEFEPLKLNSSEALTLLKGSAHRAGHLAMASLLTEDPTPLERLRSERRIYFDYLDRLREAIVERRIF